MGVETSPSSDRMLRRLAGVLAAAVAGIHLYWALPVAVDQLRFGILHDPRPAAFLLATMAMLMGVLLVVQGFDPLPVYVGGILLMLVFLVGYAAWHTVLDHGAFWPGRPAHGGHSELGPIRLVVVHLQDDSLAFASKVVEAALLAVLSVLTVRELRDR
ncbi:hypothetical protein J2751_000344 [Halorubrum alkaliphilum]|uniref:Uncharacterized protein n=1 Tax=Halorubrum alkaliphilum TaxID=261290 RepID=A0A8T4GE14_9EURY|nr:hypothetical protein [Halorubrum alkaliphilum]MBP1921355.1 hypothetical protein [Halorubrum alkaliphilum]